MRLLRSDRFWSTFRKLADFNETSDMGVFGGAESNGGVRLSWKSIFGVESIDSTIAKRSILIDLLKHGRFLTKLQIRGFPGRWIEWRCSFVLNIEIWGRIDRFDHCGAIDFDRPFETWSIFDKTSDMGVFEGAEWNGDVTFSSKSIFAVESSFASVGHFSPND